MSHPPLNHVALRRSGRLTAETLRVVAAAVRPGVTTAHLDHLAEEYTRDQGGTPAFLGHHGFPATICTSVNHEIVHGIPGETTLRDGDIVSIDMGVKIDGWYTDAAITVGVGEISDEARHLLAVTRQALRIALGEVTDGHATGDLGAAVQSYVEAAGMSVIRDCVGHGIGQKLHLEPSIPNFGRKGVGSRFRDSMTVAIEPMVVLGSPEITVADDHWTVEARDRSLAAHFEETVIVTTGEPERLTPLDEVLPGVDDAGRVGKVAVPAGPRPESGSGVKSGGAS